MDIDARGFVFQVHIGGPVGGEPVLLLHGFPQHSGEWDRVVPALHAAGLRTYALDQRGYSPLARPPEVADYRMSELVADVVAVLDSLGVGTVHLVGHDWGAAVAWCVADQHPDRVRTLTAISVPHPAALGHALATDVRQRLRSSYMLLFRRPGTAERVLLAGRAAALRLTFAGAGDAARLAGYLDPMREPGALTAALNWYRAMPLMNMASIRPVRVPTTYVWSDRDFAFGRATAESCAAHVLGDYRFVQLPGVSHWIPDQAPSQLAEVLLTRVASAG